MADQTLLSIWSIDSPRVRQALDGVAMAEDQYIWSFFVCNIGINGLSLCVLIVRFLNFNGHALSLNNANP